MRLKIAQLDYWTHFFDTIPNVDLSVTEHRIPVNGEAEGI